MNLAPGEAGTVIVCEDDPTTRDLLRQNLVADRFQVYTASTATTALELTRSYRPDLLLLDLVLPDHSGLEVLRTIREREMASDSNDPILPVILVSGASSEQDRIRCLDSGADHFLPKPVSYPELLAHIRTAMRRNQRTAREQVRIRGLVIDRLRRRVTVDERPVALSRKEFEMLCVLAEQPERIVPKEELHLRVWGHESLRHSRTLETHVSRLRCKLDPEQRRFVINAWGVGYKLCEVAGP
jgi:DNA-binding response OmpR family regulator